ncbi:hypothetical protein CRUP_025360 [Coryphaenoides rupestris]|nr:hypothetical protein CRUP_025360 [Coryphaenoides rupestris]
MDGTVNREGSKLEALFGHPLYNLPRPQAQDDDWLLRVKTGEEEEEEEEARDSADEEVEDSDGAEDGYDEANWTTAAESHPLWLRFHLGITRWELQARDAETDVNLFYFSDFERHNAEISAFHLDRILGFHRIPPVVGRVVDVMADIKDVTTDQKLSRTFFTSPVGNVCFYGQCAYYCSTEHPVCGSPRALEVSLATMLPDLSLAPRRSWRSPWRRSYSRTKLAQWEKEPAYCDTVKKTPPYDQGTRLVDLMDMAVLDFLMGNMDRHHYETFEKFGNQTFLLHLDNGRAIRRSTLLRLRLLSLPGFRLSDVVRESLAHDPLAAVQPLLSEAHLAALDRRLATVLRALRTCQEHHDDVVYDDLEGYHEEPG